MQTKIVTEKIIDQLNWQPTKHQDQKCYTAQLPDTTLSIRIMANQKPKQYLNRTPREIQAGCWAPVHIHHTDQNQVRKNLNLAHKYLLAGIEVFDYDFTIYTMHDRNQHPQEDTMQVAGTDNILRKALIKALNHIHKNNKNPTLGILIPKNGED